MTQIKAVDFFCGGGGMTFGFRQGGIDVIAGIDIDPACKETYEYNNPGTKFILSNIKDLEPTKFANDLRIDIDDENLVFIGCSPCQYWSILKTDKSKASASKNLLREFQRFVDYFRPGFVVIENVPGIFSKPGSPLSEFLDCLRFNNYISVKYKVIRVVDYGVPQTRKRFLLIASRTKNFDFPTESQSEKLTVRTFIGNADLFPPIDHGHIDETDFCHTVSGLREISCKRLGLTPLDGGSRSAWKDTEMQLNAYKRKEGDKTFGFGDAYGRLSWDKPASTITTKFFGVSHGRFAHPEQNRALSVREAATLQTFPISYVFKNKSIEANARLIGNAVPPELAKRIACSIVKSLHKMD